MQLEGDQKLENRLKYISYLTPENITNTIKLDLQLFKQLIIEFPKLFTLSKELTTVFYNIIDTDNDIVMEIILDNNVNIDDIIHDEIHDKIEHPLLYAYLKNSTNIIKLFNEYDITVPNLDNTKNSLLIKYVDQGYYNLIKYLLICGADPQYKSTSMYLFNQTALRISIYNNRLDITKLLLTYIEQLNDNLLIDLNNIYINKNVSYSLDSLYVFEQLLKLGIY